MTDPLTDEQLAEWREVTEKTDTPAPWETRTEGLGEPWRVCNDSETVLYLGFDLVADFTRGDAAFIAASREAMPRLLAEVERLRGERDEALHDMHARELHHFESEVALEAAEAKIAAVLTIAAEYPPTASSNPKSEEGMRRAARYAVAARFRLALTTTGQEAGA